MTRGSLHEMDSFISEFGIGPPTPEASKNLTLPSNRDLQPPVPDHELLDATLPEIDRLWKDLTVPDKTRLRNRYTRVAHPHLDSPSTTQNEEAWASCHDGLFRARRGDFLDSSDIYHLANRLMSWIQDQPHARLGGRSTGTWWILPDLYTLRISSGDSTDQRGEGLEETPALGSELFGEEEVKKHRHLFDQAKFTVHLVHAVWHWAVVVYQPSRGNSWYIDSLPKGRVKRSGAAQDALLAWLERSGRPRPANGRHFQNLSKDQLDSWSCGLHVIANIMAFLRFEVRGWPKIPGWSKTGAREMRAELIRCLHHLMALKFDDAHVSPTEERSKAVGKCLTKTGPLQTRLKLTWRTKLSLDTSLVWTARHRKQLWLQCTHTGRNLT